MNGEPRRQCSSLTCYSYLCEAEEQSQPSGGVEGVVDLVLDGCLTSGTVPVRPLGLRFAPRNGFALDALTVVVVTTTPKELLSLQLRLVVSVIPALTGNAYTISNDFWDI